MGRQSHIFGLCAALCATLSSSGFFPSSARGAEPSRAERRQVAAYKRAAFELFEKGAYAEGIAEMEKAHALVPHPGFLLNIAVAYRRWGRHCADALQTLDRFFVACPDCGLRSAGDEQRATTVEACAVPISVRTTPPGAHLQLDEEAVGLSPMTFEVLPGRHRLVATREGYVSAEQEITVPEGDPDGPTVLLELAAITAAPPDETLPSLVEPAPEPASGGVGAWPWVAFGVGAVGVGAGAWMTVETLRLVDEEAEARASGAGRAQIQGLRDDADSHAILAHVGYGVGLAGVITGVVLLLVDAESPPPLEVSAGPGGATIGGRF